MAAASLFAAVLRRCRAGNPSPNAPNLRSLPHFLARSRVSRALSSLAGSSRSEDPGEEPPPHPSPEDDLKSWIFRLRLPKRSATAALERWVGEGRNVTAPELRQIARDLRRSQRYKHALEILEWMQSRGSFRILAPDRALKLELITKVRGLPEAEAYFDGIRSSASLKAASLPLLRCYVKKKDREGAETLMTKLQNLGVSVNPQPFNEVMKLYMATGQYEKVPDLIYQMKRDMIPLNFLSYNLWMNASSEVSGISSVEKVYEEMVNDENVEVGWSTYSTLAHIYTKSGEFDKALTALKSSEERLSLRNRLGYSFLITQYAALDDRDGVLRLWESSKRVAGRITCENYMCMMLCLVKIGDIEET